MRLEGYTEREQREAENRIFRDMGVGGGQGRTPEEVGRDSGSAFLCILVVLAAVAFVVFSGGCSTVAGVGRDLQDWSHGIRGSVQQDAERTE